MLPRIRSIIDALFRRSRLEQAMDSELKSHIDSYTEDLIRSGVPRSEAERRARVEFGGLEAIKEECRDARGVGWSDELRQNLRYVFRVTRKAPAFTLAAVVTLALGIGANTAIFSLVHAVLLKPLPFRDPSRLIVVWDTYAPVAGKLGVSPLEREALEQQNDLFQQAAWYRYVPQNLNLTEPGWAAVEVHATFISSKLLPMLGVAPALGRVFSESEPSQSVLLNDQLWKSRFGSDPGIIGRRIRLDDQDFTVVGVMPAAFQFPESTDIWLPQGPLLHDELTNPVRHSLGFIARLLPGATQQQATVRVGTIFHRLAVEHPATSKGFGVEISGLQDDLTAKSRPALLLLWGAVALVLLIACGNFANLLLSRATARSKEMATRIALGAGMGRLVRQLLTESMVLAAGGGAAGLALAASSLAMFSPIRAPIDSAVLLFLFLISAGAGIVFGFAPALQALRVDPMAAIKSGSAGHRHSPTARGVLVILEFAFSIVVVVGAGILAKSFLRLMHVDPGFNPNGVLTLRLSWPPSQDPIALFHRMEERLRTLPGVKSIAAANTLPLVANRAYAIRFHVPGSPLINPDALPVAQLRAVSPEYFRAMQIPVKRGRPFTEQELRLPLVVINESMARRYWPGKDPVGTKFVTGPWGPKPNWSTIVGVVGDVKQFSLDSEPTMDIYFPNLAPAYLILQTSADRLSIAGDVQRQIQAIHPGLAVSDVRTMNQVLEQSADSRRWTMGLLSAFAGLALVLALVGIYGVMSWVVSQQTREIGIRMALGADRGRVLWAVIRYGAKLCAIGLTIGLAGAFVLRRVLSGLVFKVGTADPWIYSGAAMLMIVAALLACYVPAHRASRVDPLVALRWE